MILIRNIKKLYGINTSGKEMRAGAEMAEMESVENAWLLIENDKICKFGTEDSTPQNINTRRVINAKGKSVFPAFVDSHTHLVYAGSREIEYIDKIKGLSYEEIAKRGGGILNSAEKLRKTDENRLYEQAYGRIKEIAKQGTCAVEIKSGYGLHPDEELKMLRVIKRLKENTPLEIKSTFLAAHAVPKEYKNKQSDYVKMVIEESLPRVARQKAADFVDVFCDKGFFTVSETEQILEAAQKYGLPAKIHANELDYSGGVQAAVKYKAVSADHLEYVGEDEIAAFQNSDTMPTILPGAALFLNLPYAPARKMIDAGLPLAVASDFNPGSSPSGNMKLMLSLAMINHKMTAQECLNAGTLNTAKAMQLSNKTGSIAEGHYADFIISKEIPNLEFFFYAYGSSLIDTVFIKGKEVSEIFPE